MIRLWLIWYTKDITNNRLMPNIIDVTLKKLTFES